MACCARAGRAEARTEPATWHSSSESSSAGRSRRPRGAPAHPEDDRARGLLVRRDLVDRVRDRGDPLRHRGRRVEPRARPRHARADRDRGRGPARDRRHVVPPDDLRLPERRRQLRRQPREPRREPVARRGRVAARRLHPHGRGVDLGRRRRDHLDPRVPRASPDHRVALGLVPHRVHHAREPARRQGVGPALRGPDLRLHRHRSTALVVYGLYRSVFAVRRSTRSRSTRQAFDGVRDDRRRRSACSSSSRASRRARSRSPVSRRSRTACPRSGGRSRRTRPRRSCGWASSSARCSSACRSSRTTSDPYPSEHETVFVADRAPRCSATAPCSTGAAVRDRRRSSRSPRTPRTPTSRGCRRSSPATATCRASSRTAATGSCSRTASSCSRSRPALLIVAFGGKTNALIPLYAVGVFMSFTLSQAGMVRHHRRSGSRAGKRNIVINGVGAVATLDRAADRRDHEVHERRVGADRRDPADRAAVQGDQAPLPTRRRRRCASPPSYKPRRMNHTVVVLVGGVHRGVLEALAYAKSLHPNHLVAVTIVSDEEEQERIEQRVGGVRHRRPARDRLLALPGAHRVRSCATSTSSTPARRTTSSRSCSPSSSCGTGGATCSTTRARCS